MGGLRPDSCPSLVTPAFSQAGLSPLQMLPSPSPQIENSFFIVGSKAGLHTQIWLLGALRA